jgi:hypothetical protein
MIKTLSLYIMLTLFGAVWAIAQTPEEKAGGQIITFDPPGSSQTFSTSLNSKGEVVGSFSINQTTQVFCGPPMAVSLLFSLHGPTQLPMSPQAQLLRA